MDIPRILLIFQPETRIERKTRRSIEKRRTMEQPIPSLDTFIG